MDNRLRVFCETRELLIGVDNPSPRFSWQPYGEGYRYPQYSYAVTVRANGREVWSSGETVSSNSTSVEYGGEALQSFTEYTYSVTSTLTDGCVLYGEGRFETGILHAEEWQGDFLAYADYKKRVSPVFYTSFECKNKLLSARAYFCGLGYGELYINGKKSDDSLLDPAWTDYTQRVLYRTFDVTPFVMEGQNHIGVLLGDGWMAHNHKYFEKKPPLPWYHEPCFLLNVRLCYADGSVETFSPNTENTLVTESHILSNNVFDGEVYDAARAAQLYRGCAPAHPEEWSRPVRTVIDGILSSQIMSPIRRTEILRPERIVSIEPSIYTVDMGVNFAGFLKLCVKGDKGSSVVIKYAEVASDDDRLLTENLRYAQCTDTYILSGNADGEEYSPRFTYRGFRFAEITLVGAVKVTDVTGVRVCSAVERIGHFECDSEIINRIYRMLINTEINNMHSVPTDCPQRDERLGWLNDNTLRLEQNFMNFDSRLFYEKWLEDMRDEQKKTGTGAVPDTCPYYYGRNPARWNTTVFVSVPYFIYKYYGDMQPMRKHWKNALWYMDFQKTKLNGEGLIDEFYVGEWCPPMRDSILEDKQSAFAKDIKNQLATSCFYIYECMMCAEMARLLGDEGNIARFRAEIETVREAINAKFFSYEKCSYIPECQGNNIFPLFLGIVPDGYEERVAQTLVSCIERDGYHISTGSHMTRFLFETLDKIGRNDVGVKMLSVRSYPSFGYMLENGATSLWERWEKSLGFMTSHDHPMTGGFGVWFFKALGGIYVGLDTTPDALLIRPWAVGELAYVKCSRSFPNGEAYCIRKTENGVTHYDIGLPWNMEATIELDIHDARCIILNGKPLDETTLSVKRDGGTLRISANGGYIHAIVG